MANNRINRYIGAIAIGTVLTVVPSCTDTWDDHYDSDESVAGTTLTLWDMIKDNPNYSKFAEIVRNAKYYKDNTHPVSTYTYADILAGGQVNTVWVPDNSVLTDEEYAKWMEMLTESNADAEGVNVAGYNVQQQFLGNHIALWRHNISEPGVDTVKMINGKNLEFDKTSRALEGIPLGEYNIPAANGVMHVLKGIAPFRYNFYEYLKFREPQTEFGKYVVSKDTTYFSADNSIEGLPDENGNPTYVDSVYFTSNRLFESRTYLPREGAEKWQMEEKCFHARINNEDSVFVMIMPTDAAWNSAYEMLKESYNYANYYDDKSKGDLNSPTTIKGLNPDSLQKTSIEMDLIAPLVFNIHKQPKRGEEMWTLEMFKRYKGDGGKANSPDEYLYNTFGDTLRNVGDWDKTSLFDGEPVEMSNGLAFEVNSWNFPKEFYTPDVEVEIENMGIFYNTESTKFKVGVGSRRYSFSNEAYSKITDLYGKVSNGNFYHMDAPGPTNAPKAEIKLIGNNPNAYVPNAQVMSGKYDIQLVVVPHWYIDIASAAEIEPKFFKKDTIVSEFDETDTIFVPTTEIDTNYVRSLASINKFKFRTQITYNNNQQNAKDANSSWVTNTYDGLKVDTITIAEDFNFPYSYKNMRFSYPTLVLEGYTGKSDAKNGFVYDLVIDKVILRRKN
ncbi:MAG: hypothetical protein J6W03_10565 [Bacteroidaceae bacterium]|nr:hypothetical protein [Bacteroidaceae bacterium]